MASRCAGGRPGRPIDRRRFERGARSVYPTLRGGPTKRTTNKGFTYTLSVPVPCYETRNVTIVFRTGERIPVVMVDGPPDSPHRYSDGGLCMWHPNDPSSQRWRFEDGLLDLVDAVAAHLFREAWWREHTEWLGPEVEHAPAPSPDPRGAA